MSVLHPKSRSPLERMMRIHHEIVAGSEAGGRVGRSGFGRLLENPPPLSFQHEHRF